jgi:uncharacterized protein (DUF2225 family)
MTILRDVRLQCPVCERQFTSREVVSTDGFKRTDFQVRIAGEQPTQYLVHVCPRCGYAGRSELFADDAAPAAKVVERVWAELTPLVTAEALTGSEKFELAAKVAVWAGASASELGDLYLRASWCCVDEGDTEGERYFRRHAAWSFERALGEWDGVDRTERAVLTYLVGELWRRIGDDRKASEWYDRVSMEAASTGQTWLIQVARQQKEDPRDWFAGEMARAAF